MPEKPTSLRLDGETLARLDKVSEAMAKRPAGVQLGRSTIIKLAVERGLPILESELGLTAKRPKPRK